MTVTVLWKEIEGRVAAGNRFAGLFATLIPRRRTCTVRARDVARWNRYAGGCLSQSGAGSYPALTPRLGAAFWYEREIHDDFGVVPEGHPRLAPLFRPGSPEEHALTRHVAGYGVFTIPHGPVRSGVVESIEYLVETPGEAIPHLNMRVFYKHRGIENRYPGMTAAGGRAAGRAGRRHRRVAHALAYCHAIERIAGGEPPRAGGLVRVLYAELERVANHLDVAVRLADAAGLAVATARFALHKERVLRLVSRMCGSRFGRGVVVPGGVSALPRLSPAEILAELARLRKAVTADAAALMATSSFLDRLRGTGPLKPERARRARGARPDRQGGRVRRRRPAGPPVRRVPAGPETGPPRMRPGTRWPGCGSGGRRWTSRSACSAGPPKIFLPNGPPISPWPGASRPADARWAGPRPRRARSSTTSAGGRPDRPVPSPVGVVPQPGADARGVRRRHPDRLPVHRGQLRAVRGGGGPVICGRRTVSWRRRGNRVSIWVLRGLRDGVVTTRWPRRPDEYADSWRGPATAGARAADLEGVDGRCARPGRSRPGRTAGSGSTRARASCAGGAWPNDRTCSGGRRARPGPAPRRSPGGSSSSGVSETDEAVAAARARLAERTAALRRSVHVRHVDAGSDGSEEWEIQALLGPVYDISRLGVFFTASPRHADVLLVTGVGARGMTAAAAHDLRGDARSSDRDRGRDRRGQRRAAEPQRGHHGRRWRHGTSGHLAARARRRVRSESSMPCWWRSGKIADGGKWSR